MGKSMCSVCNVFLPSDESRNQHVTGKKHTARVALLENRAKTAAKSVFVMGFKKGTVDLVLADYFNKFGAVAKVIMDKDEGKYAIVEFASSESAEKAVYEVPHNLQGRRLIVKPRELKPLGKMLAKSQSPSQKIERQSHVLHHAILMNKLKAVPSTSDQMQCLVELTSLTLADIQQRENLGLKLQDTLKDYFPACSVHLFGSTVTGLGLKGCDVDIFLNLECKDEQVDKSANLSKEPESECDIEAPTLEQIKSGAISKEELLNMPFKIQLHFVQRVIRKHLPGAKRVIYILSARCPIIKFYHAHLGVGCDVSCKNKLSIYNTQLLKLYSDADVRVRPLMMALRYWGKLNGLTASGHLLTNYAFTLMILFFLQTREPPVISSVDTLKDLENSHLEIDGWDCSFCKDLDKIPKSQNLQSMGELLKEFFHFYVTFDFTMNVISIRNGTKIPKSFFISSDEDYLKAFKFGPICIQDPFDLSHNVAANVNDAQFTSLIENMEKAHQKCSIDDFEERGLMLLFERRDDGNTALSSTTNVCEKIGSGDSASVHLVEKNIAFEIPLKGHMMECVLSSAINMSEDKIKRHCMEVICKHILEILKSAFMFDCKIVTNNLSIVLCSRKRVSSDMPTTHTPTKKICMDSDIANQDESKNTKIENNDIAQDKTSSNAISATVPNTDASSSEDDKLLELCCCAYYRTWCGRRKIRRAYLAKCADSVDPNILITENCVSKQIAEQSGERPPKPIVEFKCLLRAKKKTPSSSVLVEFVPVKNVKEFKGVVFTCLQTSLPKLVEQCMDEEFSKSKKAVG